MKLRLQLYSLQNMFNRNVFRTNFEYIKLSIYSLGKRKYKCLFILTYNGTKCTKGIDLNLNFEIP